MAERAPIRLAASDVDGTLLRGLTVCEQIAGGIGRESEMEAFGRLSTEDDISRAREEMAEWYQGHEPETLVRYATRVTAKSARSSRKSCALTNWR